jgi:hypothetical protein
MRCEPHVRFGRAAWGNAPAKSRKRAPCRLLLFSRVVNSLMCLGPAGPGSAVRGIGLNQRPGRSLHVPDLRFGMMDRHNQQ